MTGALYCCRYFQDLIKSRPSPEKRIPAKLIGNAVHSVSIAAVSWTQAGDGILVSGATGEVAMYEVPQNGDTQPTRKASDSDPKSALSASEAVISVVCIRSCIRLANISIQL